MGRRWSSSTAEEAIAQEGEPRRYEKRRRKRERRPLKFPTLIDRLGWRKVGDESQRVGFFAEQESFGQNLG